MVRSLSKKQILILDCCFSGAFSKDWISDWNPRSDASVGIKQKLTGEGRVVLTAADALEYAYEKGSAAGEVKSLFSSRLIEGIEGGYADLDGDGFISVDELYTYVEERIRQEDPSQKPQKLGQVYGQLWIGRAAPRPDAIPRNVLDLLNHNYPTARLAGIDELERLLTVAKDVLYPAASQALTKLLSDGDGTVQRVAASALRRLEAERRESEEKNRLEAERRQKEQQERLEAERRETEAKERLETERRQARPPTAAADQDTGTEDRQSVVPGTLPGPSPPPTVIVLSPKGGERWETETCHAISWKAIPGNSETKVKRIDLELFKDETMLESIAGEDTRLDGERQSFDWNLPGTLKPGDNYKLKVIAWDDRGQSGHSFSNGGFSVVPKSPPNDQAPGAIPEEKRAWWRGEAPGAILGAKDPWWLYSNSTHRLLLLYALYHLLRGIWFVVTNS